MIYIIDKIWISLKITRIMLTLIWVGFLDVRFEGVVKLTLLPSYTHTKAVLWQFCFIQDWPVIWKSEIPSSEFFPKSWDWVRQEMPILVRMSLINCYLMLQYFRVTALTVSELLGKTNWARKTTLPLPPIQIRAIDSIFKHFFKEWKRILFV